MGTIPEEGIKEEGRKKEKKSQNYGWYVRETSETDSLRCRFGLAVKRQAGKQTGQGSIPLRLSFLLKKRLLFVDSVL